MVRKSLIKYCFFILSFQLTAFPVIAQNNDSSDFIIRNNIIKIDLIPVTQAISGHNQIWTGIEYERYLKVKLSVSVLVNFGLFENYTFTKYHDFFDEEEGFGYTRKEVTTKGYHLIPAVKYYFWISKHKRGQGVYFAGNLGFNQYFKKSTTYFSGSDAYEYQNSSTSRVSIGATVGGQFVAFSRLAIDLNISLFGRLYSSNTGQDGSEIKPLDPIWTFNDDKCWSTVSLAIGYAFGGGKKK